MGNGMLIITTNFFTLMVFLAQCKIPGWMVLVRTCERISLTKSQCFAYSTAVNMSSVLFVQKFLFCVGCRIHS